jgi:hypothetical protein
MNSNGGTFAFSAEILSVPSSERLLGLLIGWLWIGQIRLLIWGRMGCFKGCSSLFAAAALVAASLGLLESMGCRG